MIPQWSIPVVQWLSHSPLDPRLTGLNPAGFDGFLERKNPEYDLLRKGSKARVVDLRHVKEPQAEIRASEQNLLHFSRSM